MLHVERSGQHGIYLQPYEQWFLFQHLWEPKQQHHFRPGQRNGHRGHDRGHGTGVPAENSTVEIPTLYFDSAEAYERHLNQLKSDVSTHANGNAVISAAVVRSGSSEDCELYIEWDGNAVYSSFRYKQITVKTTSMLGDEKPYATFGTGRHFVTRPATAGMTGSVKIGDFKLSSDINKVIVKSSSLQAYNLTKATWQSSIEFSGMVWVK